MQTRKSSIIAIQNNKDSNRLLVYFDPDWGFWMFPSCKMIDEDDIRTYLAFELQTDPDTIAFSFFAVGHETKYAVPHKEERSYKYFVHIGHAYRLPETDFEIDGRKYRWMTPDEMHADPATEKNNSYVIETVSQML